MRRTLSLLFFITLVSKLSFSQVYLEPFTGYQKDINNSGIHLINSGIRLSVKKNKQYEFLFQLQASWPLPYHHSDSSFSLNPGLPFYQPAQKLVHISSFSAGVGNRIRLTGSHDNKLFLNFYAGIMYQKLTVSYQYDKINYILLNPDKTQEKASIYLSTGLTYIRDLKSSRFLVEVNLSSPPVTGKNGYPVSLHLIAPLSVNIGYAFKLSKK